MLIVNVNCWYSRHPCTATRDHGARFCLILFVSVARGTLGALVSVFHGDQRKPRRAREKLWNFPLTLWYGCQDLPSKLLFSRYRRVQQSPHLWHLPGCPWVAMAVTVVTLPRSTCSHSPSHLYAAQPSLLFNRASAATPCQALLAVRAELGSEPSWSPSAELQSTEPQPIWLETISNNKYCRTEYSGLGWSGQLLSQRRAVSYDKATDSSQE